MNNSIWIILLILIILIVGGIMIFKAVAPAALQLHESSMAPIRSIAGNPNSQTALMAMV